MINQKKEVMGFINFKLMKEYQLKEVDLIVYSLLVTRLQYVSMLRFKGKAIENFNIDEKGFGRVSMTYDEAYEDYGITNARFTNAIRSLNAKGLLYFKSIPSTRKQNTEVNVFYPVIADGTLGWEQWAFRVWKPHGEILEPSLEAHEFTIEDILNKENHDEELYTPIPMPEV